MRELALAASRRDDARSGVAGQLDEDAADAAGGRLDEHGLAGLHGGGLDQRQRRAAVGEQRGRVASSSASGTAIGVPASTATRSA